MKGVSNIRFEILAIVDDVKQQNDMDAGRMKLTCPCKNKVKTWFQKPRCPSFRRIVDYRVVFDSFFFVVVVYYGLLS